MKLFLSDIHLGSPLFEKENQLKQLFNCDKYDEIFIIGDIIDTWEHDTYHIVKKFSSLIEAVNNCKAKVHIIKGNHDPGAVVLDPIFHSCHVSDSKELELDGKKVILTHGHEFDGVLIKYFYINKILFPLQWVCEKFNIDLGHGLRTLFHSVSAKIKHTHYNDIVVEIEKRAIEKYKNYDIIVMGHTHLDKFVYTSKPNYINTGSLLHDPCCVEYDSGVFSKRRV